MLSRSDSRAFALGSQLYDLQINIQGHSHAQQHIILAQVTQIGKIMCLATTIKYDFVQKYILGCRRPSIDFFHRRDTTMARLLMAIVVVFFCCHSTKIIVNFYEAFQVTKE